MSASHNAALLVLALATAAPAAGQAPPLEGSQPLVPAGYAFRTTLGASYLLPFGDNSAPAGRLPSARLSFTRQSSPRVAFNLSGIRLAVDRPGPANALQMEQDALLAGLLGFRVNITTGRVRVGPFFEGGAGQLQAQIDSGHVVTSVVTAAFGGGGGVVGEVILGPGATLEVSGGYLHFLTATGSVAPLTGPYATVGLRWSFRDEPWYWRTSGRDVTGPTIALLAPEADSSGVINVDQASVQLRFAVRDPAGVASLSVAAAPVRLRRAPRDFRVGDDAGPWWLGDVVVQLEPGENRFGVIARDEAEQRSAQEYIVMGPVPEAPRQEPPLIAAAEPPPEVALEPLPTARARIEIIEPAGWRGTSRGIQAVQRTSQTVRGLVAYDGRISYVTLNDAMAALQLDDDGHSGTFGGFVAIEPGLRSVTVEVFNSEGRLVGEETYNVDQLAPTLPPTLHALQPLTEFQGQRFALIIGISDYLDDRIGDLSYADDDARSFYEFLASPAAGMSGIPRSNMTLLVDQDATVLNISDALADLQARATENDVIIFYVAAHGMQDRMNNYFLLAHDTPLDRIASRGVRMDELTDDLGRMSARMKVAFVDACHAGGMGSRATRATEGNRANDLFMEMMRSSTGGWVTFTAAEGTQLSEEGAEWGGGHGVFTYMLLQGLRGNADDNGDDVVDLGELLEFTRDRVRRETGNAQIPSIQGAAYDRHWPMALLSPAE